MKLRWMNVRDRTERAELLRLSPFCAVLTERGALCASAQLHLAREGEGRGVAVLGAATFGGTSPRASRHRRTSNINH